MVRLGRTGSAPASDRRAAWNETALRFAIVPWPATACAFLFGGTLLPLMFAGRYASAVPLFFLATLEIPQWILPVDALLRAAGRTRFLFAWCAARLPITGGSVLLGMRLGGLGGAILGGVVSEAISRVVMCAAGAPYLGVRPGVAATERSPIAGTA